LTRRRSALDARRTAPGQSQAGSGEGTHPPPAPRQPGRARKTAPQLPGLGEKCAPPSPGPQSWTCPGTCQIKSDLTEPVRRGTARHGQAAAAPQARRTPTTTPATRPAWHGMASTTPATTPPHPGRKRQPARKPGTARQNPRPGSQHQSAESGQSQEPPPGEPDIKAYTCPKQSRPSEQPSFRITAVTCLYRHCPVTVRESRNHLTNVVLATEIRQLFSR
jgi:hypothetical protein